MLVPSDAAKYPARRAQQPSSPAQTSADGYCLCRHYSVYLSGPEYVSDALLTGRLRRDGYWNAERLRRNTTPSVDTGFGAPVDLARGLSDSPLVRAL